MSYLDAIEDEEERRAALAEEEPPCSSLFDPEEEPDTSGDFELLVSGDSPDPVALFYNGKRYRVVPE